MKTTKKTNQRFKAKKVMADLHPALRRNLLKGQLTRVAHALASIYVSGGVGKDSVLKYSEMKVVETAGIEINLILGAWEL